jgi:hypothetical protein
MRPEDPLRDEITAMADALLEGRLGPADVRRLEELVCTNEDAARIYFHYMHMVGGVLPRFGVKPPGDSLEQEGPSSAAPPDVMSETMILPALRETPQPRGKPSIVLPAAPPPAAKHRFPLRRYAVAAAILIAVTLATSLYFGRGSRTNVASGVAAPPSPAAQPSPTSSPAPAVPVKPVAHLTALAAAVLEDPALRAGAPLRPGETVRIDQGAAEITYVNGAVLVVEGPALLRITDGSTAELARGKLAARVPHQAKWFRVTSSKLTVTDLGTEFGVEVNPSGVAVAHVFEGRITVALPGPSSEAPAAVRLLDRDQTVECPTHGGQIEPVPTLAETFVRDITQYAVPLRLHNTGAGIAEGQPDPNWQFVRDGNDPNLVPRPATVASPPSIYMPNTVSSRWVSTAGKLRAVPVGTYTFRTQFDLRGLDPATARILAHLAADDRVQHVRVNGREVPPPAVPNPKSKYTRFHDFAITEGFVAGTNTIEFDVFNEFDKMAFRVEWEGTARARVTR